MLELIVYTINLQHWIDNLIGPHRSFPMIELEIFGIFSSGDVTIPTNITI